MKRINETSGSGDSRSTQLVSYERFGIQQQFEAVSSATQEVEISFDVPDNDDWVTELSGRPVRYWELLIESEQTGADFKTTFPLPIYPRG